jgi:hypothetical protein
MKLRESPATMLPQKSRHSHDCEPRLRAHRSHPAWHSVVFIVLFFLFVVVIVVVAVILQCNTSPSQTDTVRAAEDVNQSKPGRSHCSSTSIDAKQQMETR